jgi:hypothetical protein
MIILFAYWKVILMLICSIIKILTCDNIKLAEFKDSDIVINNYIFASYYKYRNKQYIPMGIIIGKYWIMFKYEDLVYILSSQSNINYCLKLNCV